MISEYTPARGGPKTAIRRCSSCSATLRKRNGISFRTTLARRSRTHLSGIPSIEFTASNTDSHPTAVSLGCDDLIFCWV